MASLAQSTTDDSVELRVINAIYHLAKLDTLYECDREIIKHLSTAKEWTLDDKRHALLLVAKYRRTLIKDGFDYYKIFTKNKDNVDFEKRVKQVYNRIGYLEKEHHIKNPFGRNIDLIPFDEVERWIRNKSVEVRITNAERNGNKAETGK